MLWCDYFFFSVKFNMWGKCKKQSIYSQTPTLKIATLFSCRLRLQQYARWGISRSHDSGVVGFFFRLLVKTGASANANAKALAYSSVFEYDRWLLNYLTLSPNLHTIF